MAVHISAAAAAAAAAAAMADAAVFMIVSNTDFPVFEAYLLGYTGQVSWCRRAILATARRNCARVSIAPLGVCFPPRAAFQVVLLTRVSLGVRAAPARN